MTGLLISVLSNHLMLRSSKFVYRFRQTAGQTANKTASQTAEKKKKKDASQTAGQTATKTASHAAGFPVKLSAVDRQFVLV